MNEMPVSAEAMTVEDALNRDYEAVRTTVSLLSPQERLDLRDACRWIIEVIDGHLAPVATYRCGAPNATGGHCLIRVLEPGVRCSWHNGKVRYRDTDESAQRRAANLRQRLRDERPDLPHNV